MRKKSNTKENHQKIKGKEKEKNRTERSCKNDPKNLTK